MGHPSFVRIEGSANSRSFARLTPIALSYDWGPTRAEAQDDAAGTDGTYGTTGTHAGTSDQGPGLVSSGLPPKQTE
jgi:hypothetical protein